MKRVAAHIITPSYALAFLANLRFLHPREEVAVTLFLYKGVLGNDRLVPGMRESLAAMCARLTPTPRLVEIFEADMDAVLAPGTVEGIARAFRDRFGLDGLDEFHYAHATVGCFHQLVAGVFPRARRICFGDAFGLVHWKRIRLACFGLPLSPLPPLAADQGGLALEEACRDAPGLPLRQGLARREITPHQAVLALPVDQFGDYLDRVPFRVCPKAVVVATIEACAAGATAVREATDRLLDLGRDRTMCLLLPANFAEAEDLPLETDVAMYASLVRRYCPPGSLVCVKPHPGEVLPRSQALARRLGDDYRVEVLDKDLQDYPIEVWTRLIRRCRVISLTCPTLTLAYLFDTPVINPMSPEFIRRWWAPEKWAFRLDARTWNAFPLHNLRYWDGRGPLYAATPLSLADCYRRPATDPAAGEDRS